MLTANYGRSGSGPAKGGGEGESDDICNELFLYISGESKGGGALLYSALYIIPFFLSFFLR